MNFVGAADHFNALTDVSGQSSAPPHPQLLNPSAVYPQTPFPVSQSYPVSQSDVQPRDWDSYVAGIFKGGTDRVLVQGQRVLPLIQSPNKLVFADLRSALDDQHTLEANFGLAQRVITDPYTILGSYVFYDIRQTAHQNDFHQITIGKEYLTVPFEARVNGYIPLNGAQSAPGATTFTTTGGSILMNAGLESAYWGVDGEYGWLLADYGFSESRVFVGGYYFAASASGFPEITGPRARLEMRSFDMPVLGVGSRMTVGAEYQWDQVRDHQFNALARVVIPLGGPAAPHVGHHNRLRRRMMDRIVRDDDIVTQAVAAGPTEAAVAVLDENTQISLGANTTVVTATTQNVISDAIDTPGTNVLVLDGSAGEFTQSELVQLNDGQRVLGGGVRVVGETTALPGVFGRRPTINGTDSGQPVFVAADNSTIQGLSITGGLHAIQGTGTLSDLRIVDNHISGAAGDAGLLFEGLSGATVTGNTSTNNVGAGFIIDDNDGSTLSDNRATQNGAEGFRLTFNDGTVLGNTAEGNAADGFLIVNNNGLVSGNVAERNLGDGFEFQFQDAATSNVSNNQSSFNGGFGFNLNGDSPSTAAGNTASGNTLGNALPGTP